MNKVTLEDITHNIRDRITYAIDYNERRLLGEILTTNTIIEEASYGTDNQDILTIIGELAGWARDAGIIRVTAANLPSHEKISKVFKQVADSANSRFDDGDETRASVVQTLDLEHILHTLRDQIEKALESDERRLLEEIATALTIILEAVDKVGDKKASIIVGALWYVAREGYLGFKIKDRLPSHTKIAEAFE